MKKVFPRILAGTILALALVLDQVASAWGQDGDEGGAPIPLNEYGTPVAPTRSAAKM